MSNSPQTLYSPPLVFYPSPLPSPLLTAPVYFRVTFSFFLNWCVKLGRPMGVRTWIGIIISTNSDWMANFMLLGFRVPVPQLQRMFFFCSYLVIILSLVLMKWSRTNLNFDGGCRILVYKFSTALTSPISTSPTHKTRTRNIHRFLCCNNFI